MRGELFAQSYCLHGSCFLVKVVFLPELLSQPELFSSWKFFVRRYSLRESCFFTRGVVCSELLFVRGVILCAKELFFLRAELFAREYCLRRELFAPSRQHFAG